MHGEVTGSAHSSPCNSGCRSIGFKISISSIWCICQWSILVIHCRLCLFSSHSCFSPRARPESTLVAFVIFTMADTVPTVSSLTDIYSSEVLPTQKQRWEHLLSKFEELYGRPAEFVSRSPGRVNIIGEVSFPLDLECRLTGTAHRLLAVRSAAHGRYG